MGRVVVCTRVAEAGLAQIDEWAAQAGVGRSEMVRRLLMEATAQRRRQGSYTRPGRSTVPVAANGAVLVGEAEEARA